jgi:HEAT repeat protein
MSNNRTFQTVLNALGDDSSAFPQRYLMDFSDLPPENVSAFMALWPTVSQKRKRHLLSKLVELYTHDTLVLFESLAAALINDPDNSIRIDALRLLGESEDTHLIPRLIELAENDSSEDVRVQAMAVLGNFVELGEMGEIVAETSRVVEETLLRVRRSTESPNLQRAALEAVSYASSPEIETLIESAYQRHEPKWVSTALLAMSRSANPKWEELVLARLDDPNDDVRLSAVQAAGELHLELARQILLNMLEEEDEDQVFLAAIWSLSQIGGEDVRVTLETLFDQAEEAEENELSEYIEEALANLDFTEEMNAFNLLAIDPDDELEK